MLKTHSTSYRNTDLGVNIRGLYGKVMDIRGSVNFTDIRDQISLLFMDNLNRNLKIWKTTYKLEKSIMTTHSHRFQ